MCVPGLSLGLLLAQKRSQPVSRPMAPLVTAHESDPTASVRSGESIAHSLRSTLRQVTGRRRRTASATAAVPLAPKDAQWETVSEQDRAWSDDRSRIDASYSDDNSVESSYQTDVANRPSVKVRFTDAELVEMAVETADCVPWDALHHDLLAPNSQWRRKRGSDDVAIYTKTDDKTETFSVVAVSELPCSIRELQQILSVSSSHEYSDLMRALWGKKFLYGELLHEVEVEGDDIVAPTMEKSARSNSQASRSTQSSQRTTQGASRVADPQLTIKTAVFEKSNVFRRNEEWFYLDFLRQSEDTRTGRRVFTKTILSLHPDDVIVDDGRQDHSLNHVRHRGSMFVGYSFDEEPSGRLTRVRIYADCSLASNKKKLSKAISKLAGKHNGARARANDRTAGASDPSSLASQGMVKNRLMNFANTAPALLKILRRRRLGFQVLVDTHVATSQFRISLPQCDRCTKSFLMVHPKLCTLCGHIVCDKCSGVHERERKTHSLRTSIDSVRVCNRCIGRVDCVQLKNVGHGDLLAARVVADRLNASTEGGGSVRSESARSSSSAVLTGLLEESLKTAVTQERRTSVMKMIQVINEQDDGSERSSMDTTPASVPLTEDALEELQRKLKEPPLPLDQCVLANNGTRNYLISPGEDPETALPAPIPANEARRLTIVNGMKMQELSERPELEIICSIAAKELGCMASMITIVQEDTYHVLACNMSHLANKALPRNEGFCNQLIMDDKPLLVSHPEADVRFANIKVRKDYDVNFYCGFPLTAEDNTVIGSVCCVDQQSRELTQSQYSAMKRLAETASKVVQRKGSR